MRAKGATHLFESSWKKPYSDRGVRKILAGYRAIPVAHLPQALWLSGNVHNWQQLMTGAWQLDQLWVEGAR